MRSPASTTNYPTPRSANPLEWIKDQFAKIRNPREARGAYEETAPGSAGGYGNAGGAGMGRGRGRGFEDDAWDTRVHDDADPYGAAPGYAAGYEEQELGLAPAGGSNNLRAEPYGGAGNSDYNLPSGSRGRQGGENPFGDQNEAPSLRSVSPRPEMDPQRHKTQGSLDSFGSGGDSPTGTRKSAFREGAM
jgi:hypothetical protein